LEVELNVVRVELVPHSNQAVVAWPFGFTPPFTVVPLAVTEAAAFVATVGTGASAIAASTSLGV
jgi:hypothetical protein